MICFLALALLSDSFCKEFGSILQNCLPQGVKGNGVAGGSEDRARGLEHKRESPVQKLPETKLVRKRTPRKRVWLVAWIGKPADRLGRVTPMKRELGVWDRGGIGFRR